MTLHISDADVATVLDHRALVSELAAAHVAHHHGRLAQPLPAVLRIPGGSPDDPEHPRHVVMSAATADITVVKVLRDAPAQRAAGGRAQRSTVSVHSPLTGDCLALIDGAALTRMRTAAATALAVRTLARPGPRRIGVLGAGALAAEHLRALAATIDVVRFVVWARRPEAAAGLRAVAATTGHEVELAGSPAEVAARCDALVGTTPARDPLLHAADLRPGLHLSVVGSPPRPGFRELSEDAVRAADLVVVDDARIAAHESAQIGAALDGGLDPTRLVEIGAVLAGDHPGRTDRDVVTVHSSIGVALQDLAAVRLVLAGVGLPCGTPPVAVPGRADRST